MTLCETGTEPGMTKHCDICGVTIRLRYYDARLSGGQYAILCRNDFVALCRGQARSTYTEYSRPFDSAEFTPV